MNDAVVVLALGLVALVLAISGVAKLADRARSRQALVDLRLPAPLTTPAFATGWAIAEIVVAGALVLVPAPFTVVAGAAAVAMFAGYLVVVARASRFDEEVRCHCFGRLDTVPVGPATIVRNIGLLVLATVALVGTTHGSTLAVARSLQPADQGLLQLGLLLTGAVVSLHLMTVLGSDRATSTTAESVATAPGTALGSHFLPDLFGARHDVRRFVGEQCSVLIFLSDTCAACLALADQVPGWRNDLGERGVHVRAVTTVAPAKALSTFPRLGSFLHQDADGELATALGITGLPAAVYLGADGTPTITDGPAHGPHAISTLIDNVRMAATDHARAEVASR